MSLLSIKQLKKYNTAKDALFISNYTNGNSYLPIGSLIGVFLSLLFAWYVSLCIVFAFANYWEYSQKKYFGAKYSISDIFLTTLGGVLAILLVHQLK